MRTPLLIGIAAIAALAACDAPPEEAVTVAGSRAVRGDFVANSPIMTADAEVFEGGDFDRRASQIDAIGDVAGAPPPPPPAADGAQQGAGDLAQAGTLLAYRYGVSLELPARNVRDLMAAHEEACRAAGMTTCQILSANVYENGPDYVYGSLSLRAAPDWLAGFRDGLEDDAEGLDGRVTGETVNAEDLTNAIVDTEARLRAQRTLAARLETLLTTETDDVGDLLSVERELARVLGEIDSVTARLTMMRRRVEMSTLDPAYTSAAVPLSRNAFAPLGRAVNEFFGVFAEAAGMIVSLVAFLIPWLIVGAPLLWLLGRWWRGRRKRRAPLAEI
jgi:hypothetical protein